MPLSFPDKEVHLYLGDGQLSTEEAIQIYLQEVFAALAQKKDLEEFTINLFSEEAERAFFKCCQQGGGCDASFWCSVINHNPNLSQCYIHSCYKPVPDDKLSQEALALRAQFPLRKFTSTSLDHSYWKNKASYSQNDGHQNPKKKAVYEEFKKHLTDPKFKVVETIYEDG